ncbi:hypothetical protein HU200_037785 [Digitaria exilis]|uniref:MADS box interactor-like n=1 Tax=Digitaria exilis TaxID=1010633 RepID=A0A835EH30_9POAL|nr:hypothetical protein HU200_046466 [Digitaria exilis]KAF8695172.1 hypothetical protein HU200_037785 [Digitaria exilis]
MEPSPSSSSPAAARRWSPEVRRVRKRALEEVLEQVQRAVEMLRDADADLGVSLSESEDAAAAAPEGEDREGGVGDGADDAATSSVASDSDYETAQMCDLLKSKVESLDFLKKLNGVQKSVYQDGAVEPDSSWDIIKAVDLWEDGDPDDGYVLVKQEDVVDGITSYMAAYLLSLKKTKDLSPDQLQRALRKTFSAEKKKSRIRKAWDGTKVIYNVASWGATAVGVYNNRALLTVTSTAFRTSCRVVSKFL